MNIADTIAMLNECRDEIASLRGQIAIMAPKAEAYDAMLQVLGMMQQPNRAYGEDFLGNLDRRLRELNAKKEALKALEIPDEGEAEAAHMNAISSGRRGATPR